ncbi:MAG: glycosyltransferase [Deltaproteobacteria bacterium]|nr:glycosyltransferase [Deltaproteobacteria bacterium]
MSLASFLIFAYLLVLLLLAVYGFHRSQLVYLYFKYRKRIPKPLGRFVEKPRVTVQLPLFNEMYVVERLLDAVAQIKWPRDRLEIQVLDDSTDETVEIARRKVQELRARGLDVKYIHRTDRTGFKAGALENGLKHARGEFVLVFDADFLPGPDILLRTIDFFTDPRVGMVQTRWEHVNRNYNLLTETQALMLDGHFVVEHGARYRSGRFFNFNGTAGIWRRKAIERAGGWDHDTLTEDMDLSYRAQLKGWRFVYVPNIAAPAELPVEMNSFKSQQFRWAKGSIQVAKKLLPTILKSDAPFSVKCEAFFHLTNNFAYPLMMLLCVLLLPNLVVRTQHGIREVLLIDLPLFFGTTLSIASFYIVSQVEIGRSAWSAIKRLPLVMATGIGLCVNQARAVVEGIVGKESGEFVRTPKHGVMGKFETWTAKKYRGVRTFVPYVEIAFALYYVGAIYVAAKYQHYLTLPFLFLFASGFAYVGVTSLIGDKLAGASTKKARPSDVPELQPVLGQLRG